MSEVVAYPVQVLRCTKIMKCNVMLHIYLQNQQTSPGSLGSLIVQTVYQEERLKDFYWKFSQCESIYKKRFGHIRQFQLIVILANARHIYNISIMPESNVFKKMMGAKLMY